MLLISFSFFHANAGPFLINLALGKGAVKIKKYEMNQVINNFFYIYIHIYIYIYIYILYIIPKVFQLLILHLHQRRNNTKLLWEDFCQKVLLTNFYCVKLIPWDLNWSIAQQQINLWEKSTKDTAKNYILKDVFYESKKRFRHDIIKSPEEIIKCSEINKVYVKLSKCKKKCNWSMKGNCFDLVWIYL